ncbi:hypothetical protein [Clostridium tyrobutyricum]|uniref:hypothetical protein n=1 Tax=Clostridium tyrobutyricum TaxID=1519 RepID=UPI00057D59B8|nr:hypothetical protein [Clostridium tyrobutyricum]
MRLSNLDQYRNSTKIDIDADLNYSEFKELEKKFYKLIDNKKIISNITSMENKLNKLLEYGSLNKEDIMYKSLSKNLNDIVSIQAKPKKSIEDIYNAFYTYNNFNDIYKTINGGDNNDE